VVKFWSTATEVPSVYQTVSALDLLEIDADDEVTIEEEEQIEGEVEQLEL
jgi:hypothetical protein